MKKILHSILSACVLIGLGSCNTDSGSNRQKVVADSVIINAKILTVDKEFNIVEALAIKDSVILATGTTQEILSFTDNDTKVTNLEGKSRKQSEVKSSKQSEGQGQWSNLKVKFS